MRRGVFLFGKYLSEMLFLKARQSAKVHKRMVLRLQLIVQRFGFLQRLDGVCRERAAQRPSAADLPPLRLSERHGIEPETASDRAVKPEVAGYGDERNAAFRQEKRRKPRRVERIGADNAPGTERPRFLQNSAEKCVGETQLVIERIYAAELRRRAGKEYRTETRIRTQKPALFAVVRPGFQRFVRKA